MSSQMQTPAAVRKAVALFCTLLAIGICLLYQMTLTVVRVDDTPFVGVRRLRTGAAGADRKGDDGHCRLPRSLRFSSRENLLLVAYGIGGGIVWNINNGSVVAKFNDLLFRADFVCDDRYIAAIRPFQQCEVVKINSVPDLDVKYELLGGCGRFQQIPGSIFRFVVTSDMRDVKSGASERRPWEVRSEGEGLFVVDLRGPAIERTLLRQNANDVETYLSLLAIDVSLDGRFVVALWDSGRDEYHRRPLRSIGAWDLRSGESMGVIGLRDSRRARLPKDSSTPDEYSGLFSVAKDAGLIAILARSTNGKGRTICEIRAMPDLSLLHTVHMPAGFPESFIKLHEKQNVWCVFCDNDKFLVFGHEDTLWAWDVGQRKWSWKWRIPESELNADRAPSLTPTMGDFGLDCMAEGSRRSKAIALALAGRVLYLDFNAIDTVKLN